MEAPGTNPYKAPQSAVSDAPSDEAGEKQELKQLLFSFQGRIPRMPFWLYSLAALVVFAIAFDIRYSMGRTGAIIALPINVLYIWVVLALQVKRWHDRDKSGWWILLGFIPVIGTIWVFVETGCLRGTEGGNRFGGDPTDLY
jgi:uncharacterized membrane protein YhaH (DUF805 family)